MCPQGLIKPSNAILYAGEPIVQEMEIKTAANCYPGRLVITGSEEWECVVATSAATTCIGVLDVEPGQRRTTAYDATDQARVLRGDIVVLLKADTGCAIVIGQSVYPADAGMVQGATTVPSSREVGYALQKVATDTQGTLLVKLTI